MAPSKYHISSSSLGLREYQSITKRPQSINWIPPLSGFLLAFGIFRLCWSIENYWAETKTLKIVGWFGMYRFPGIHYHRLATFVHVFSSLFHILPTSTMSTRLYLLRTGLGVGPTPYVEGKAFLLGISILFSFYFAVQN